VLPGRVRLVYRAAYFEEVRLGVERGDPVMGNLHRLAGMIGEWLLFAMECTSLLTIATFSER
jgi:hypothetical protein